VDHLYIVREDNWPKEHTVVQNMKDKSVVFFWLQLPNSLDSQSFCIEENNKWNFMFKLCPEMLLGLQRI
jgi:hypothetical protein